MVSTETKYDALTQNQSPVETMETKCSQNQSHTHSLPHSQGIM